MNKFAIPARLKEIETLQNPDERQKAFTALARKLEIPTADNEDTAAGLDELELVKKINDTYKRYITGLTVKVGFLLIVLSGINAIVRSCHPV